MANPIIETGDFIVSLTTTKQCITEGDIFIAWKTFHDYVYYQGPKLITPLTRKTCFRLANEIEKAAYLSGFRSIYDIGKPETEWVVRDYRYFWGDPKIELSGFKSHFRNSWVSQNLSL